MMRRFSLFLAFAFGSTLALVAQPAEGNSVRLSASHSLASDARLESDRMGELSVSTLNASARLGGAPLSDGFFTYGVAGEWLGIDREERVPLPPSIGGGALELGYSQPIWGDKRLALGLRPGVFGTGFDIGGSALVFGDLSPRFSWIAGIVWDIQGEFPVFPIVGFIWRPDNKWTVALRAPRSEVVWQATPELALSFGLSVQGGAYRTGSVAASPAGKPDLSHTWFDYRELRVGPAVEWKISERTQFELEGGWTIDRRFEFDDRDVTLRTKDSAYGRLAVSLKW